jgi:hypothetical protein
MELININSIGFSVPLISGLYDLSQTMPIKANKKTISDIKIIAKLSITHLRIDVNPKRITDQSDTPINMNITIHMPARSFWEKLKKFRIQWKKLTSNIPSVLVIAMPRSDNRLKRWKVIGNTSQPINNTATHHLKKETSSESIEVL